jgi:ribonuclease P protein component
MLSEEGVYPVSMAVSVPKRLFKRAVDRNLLKRRIKEAYRLNKQLMYDFLQDRKLRVHLIIQYTQKDISDFQGIESGILQGFEKVQQDLTKQAGLADNGSSSQSD